MMTSEEFRTLLEKIERIEMGMGEIQDKLVELEKGMARIESYNLPPQKQYDVGRRAKEIREDLRKNKLSVGEGKG